MLHLHREEYVHRPRVGGEEANRGFAMMIRKRWIHQEAGKCLAGIGINIIRKKQPGESGPLDGKQMRGRGIGIKDTPIGIGFDETVGRAIQEAPWNYATRHNVS
jgi:hypothetical protein